MPDDERRLAAFHEAGHAVASVMRGGSSLTSVSLSDERDGEGMTWGRHAPWDYVFIVWAGPWAEARHPWGERDLEDTDDEVEFISTICLGSSSPSPATPQCWTPIRGSRTFTNGVGVRRRFG